jgi:hypothetical protein
MASKSCPIQRRRNWQASDNPISARNMQFDGNLQPVREHKELLEAVVAMLLRGWLRSGWYMAWLSIVKVKWVFGDSLHLRQNVAAKVALFQSSIFPGSFWSMSFWNIWWYATNVLNFNLLTKPNAPVPNLVSGSNSP